MYAILTQPQPRRDLPGPPPTGGASPGRQVLTDTRILVLLGELRAWAVIFTPPVLVT